jgi:excisionase family DNA binding protein
VIASVLTAPRADCTIPFPCKGSANPDGVPKTCCKLRDAALQLGISFPTIKQWIYKKKIRSIRTAGGHHRIPESEVDKLLFQNARQNGERTSEAGVRRVSGRNQLVGRIDSVRISGLMAEVEDFDWQSANHIDYYRAFAREMQLKAGQTAAALIKATEVMILRV